MVSATYFHIPKNLRKYLCYYHIKRYDQHRCPLCKFGTAIVTYYGELGDIGLIGEAAVFVTDPNGQVS